MKVIFKTKDGLVAVDEVADLGEHVRRLVRYVPSGYDTNPNDLVEVRHYIYWDTIDGLPIFKEI